MRICKYLFIAPLIGAVVGCSQTPRPQVVLSDPVGKGGQAGTAQTAPLPAQSKPPQPDIKIVDDSNMPQQKVPLTVAKGSVQLKLNLKPGSDYKYETTFQSNGSSEKVVTTWSVVDRTALGYTVKLNAGPVNATLLVDYYGNAEWKSVSAKDGMRTLSLLASAGCLFGFAGIRYPDAPVGPKTVWQDRMNVNKIFLMAVNNPNAKVAKDGLPLMWTLRSIAKAKGRDVTVLAYEQSGTGQLSLGSFSSNAAGTVIVDNQTGLPDSIDIEYASTLEYSGSTQSLSAVAKTRRVK